MATRYGHEIAEDLVKANGWAWAPHDPEVFGDRWVIDPMTGEKMDPYSARELQSRRDMEELDRVLGNARVVFWKCPKKCTPNIQWQQTGPEMQATCQICGEKSPVINVGEAAPGSEG